MLEPGRIFGEDFRVVRRLGEGGMGAVYEVAQLSTGRPRALKVMHDRFHADATLRERFAREARVAALIDSDHVADVVAAGVEEDGVPWMVMELLEGEDLGALIARRGSLPVEEALPIMRQICHALGAAHDAGIVHRDLKPENVFLTRGRHVGPDLTVKVLDFGIAKLLARSRTAGTSAVGSPGWMPPEQTDPKSRIDAPADVWTLGLVLFYMLTGKRFWCALDQPDAAVEALLREMLFEPIPPASVRSRELGAVALDVGLDPWFARCIHRRATSRFSNATDAFEALERQLRDTGIAATTEVSSGPVAESAPGSAPRADALPTVTIPTVPAGESFAPTPTEPTGVSERTMPAVADTPVPAGDRAEASEPRWRWVAAAGVLATAAVAVAVGTRGPSSSAITTASVDEPRTSVPIVASATSRAASTVTASAAPTASHSASAAVSSQPVAIRPAAASVDLDDWRTHAQGKLSFLSESAKTTCRREGVGGVIVTLEVTPQGAVSSAKVRAHGEVPGRIFVSSCVKAIAQSLEFLPPGSRQTLSKLVF